MLDICSDTRRFGSLRQYAATLFGVFSILLVIFIVVDAQPAAQIAIFGALMAASMMTSAIRVETRTTRPGSVAVVAADQQRRRGSYRRQEQPDAPGRPLPRAPGSVL